MFVRVALFPLNTFQPVLRTHLTCSGSNRAPHERRRRRSAAMGKLHALRSRRQRRRNMTRLLKAGSVLVVTAGAQRDTTTDAARRLRTTGAFRPGCGVFDFVPWTTRTKWSSGRGGSLKYVVLPGPAEMYCIVRLIAARSDPSIHPTIITRAHIRTCTRARTHAHTPPPKHEHRSGVRRYGHGVSAEA